MKYPKQLYVQQHKDGEETYYVSCDKSEDIDEDGDIAIYELVNTGKIKTKVTIELNK